MQLAREGLDKTPDVLDQDFVSTKVEAITEELIPSFTHVLVHADTRLFGGVEV